MNSQVNRSQAVRQKTCIGCGSEGHFVQECKKVDEAVSSGLCRRDVNGKVILSTGSEIPRSIPGDNLLARIREWHKRNPGQTSSGSLLLESFERVPTQSAFNLSTEERIESLTRELNALRARRQVEVQVPRIGRARRHQEGQEELVQPKATTPTSIPDHIPAPVSKPTTAPATVPIPHAPTS